MYAWNFLVVSEMGMVRTSASVDMFKRGESIPYNNDGLSQIK